MPRGDNTKAGKPFTIKRRAKVSEDRVEACPACYRPTRGGYCSQDHRVQHERLTRAAV